MSQSRGRFYFSGLSSGWFSENFFDEYSIFGYIGSRDRLVAHQSQRSLLRRLVEVGAKNVSLANAIKLMAGFPLLNAPSDGKTAGEQILDAFRESESAKNVKHFLSKEQRRALNDDRRRNRNFDCLKAGRRAWPWNGDARLQDQLVTIEGHLVHRSAVQYDRATSDILSHSTDSWLLSDFPAHGLCSANNRYKGQLMLLRTDEGFASAFGSHLPFWTVSNWYPYVRITGFADVTKLDTERLPAIWTSFVEYRRPQPWLSVAKSIGSFFDRELQRPNWLKERPNLLMAASLVPLVTCGSGIRAQSLEDDMKGWLTALRQRIDEQDEMGLAWPGWLSGWYDELAG